MNKKLVHISLVIILLAGITGYYFNVKSSADVKENIQEKEPAAPKITKTISIGVISDNAVKHIKLFQPTADYIAAKLSDNSATYEGKVIVVRTIDNMTELLREQKLDLYMESPFATVIIANKSGAVPFLRRWKDGAAEYHSVFIARKNSSINTVADFAGKTIAFEDPGSTSGYLLPKAYLIQNGLNVSQSAGKSNIRYTFTGEDENTPLWVVEGTADIGAISDLNFKNLPGSIKVNLKMIDRTIDVPRFVVSHRSGMEPAMVEQIRQILLNMDQDPQGIKIMKDFQNTAKYDDISSEDEIFARVRDMIRLLE
ncbi:MAG: phosphate/phosphite/phosphonate ABC transporter substrate-binding protein [Candidatus Methanoperedens sp.]|nr:phosphate/phosphite/phosphonate ABC transporter substrate-binding protein [Candidatus Methanoperedens sp.]